MVNLTVVLPSLFSHLYYKRVYKTLKIQSLKKTPTKCHCVSFKILAIKDISPPYQKSYCKLVISSQKKTQHEKTNFSFMKVKAASLGKQSSCKTV